MKKHFMGRPLLRAEILRHVAEWLLEIAKALPCSYYAVFGMARLFHKRGIDYGVISP